MKHIVFLSALLFSTAVFANALFAADNAKYNVLFINMENTRWNIFGCYGNPICQTPNIDKLAASGIRFEKAYCNASACNASRTSFLHGLRPKTNRIWSNQRKMVDFLPKEFEKENMPQLFKDAGYTIIDIGKVYHGPDYAPEQLKAFDRIEYFPQPESYQGPPPLLKFNKAVPNPDKVAKTRPPRNGKEYDLPPSELTDRRRNADRIGDSGLEFEEEQDTRKGLTTAALLKEFAADKNPNKKPFFIALGMSRPHPPFLSPTKYAAKYNPETIPDPPAPLSSLKNFPYMHRATGGNPDTFVEYQPSPKEAKAAIAANYGCVSFVDDVLGIVFDTLKETNLDKNTIVVLIGDHGIHLGDHNLWNMYDLLDGTHHAPLIIRVPDAKENGKVCRQIVEFVDILPTFIDLCGLRKPEQLEGISLKPLLEKDVNTPWKTAAFITDQDEGDAVLTAQYRYIEFGEKSIQRKDGIDAALYDLLKDPEETNNVVNEPEYVSVKKELAELLRKGWKAALPPEYNP